jgi:transposase InsO family protein
MNKKHSIRRLSVYFGYTRDARYKSSTASEKEVLSREVLMTSVLSIRKTHPRMGGKKIYYLLKDLPKELGIGRDKFFEIMREEDLLVKRKKSGIKTTNSYHRFHVYKNELAKTIVRSSNRAWVCDITYIRTSSGFVYLFLLTDVWSRKIVGWSLSNNLSLEGGIKALKKALKQCDNPAGVIRHSDRGIQYCGNVYTDVLRKHGMCISMTEENHCYENAVAERVNVITVICFFRTRQVYDEKKIYIKISNNNCIVFLGHDIRI